MKNKSVAELKNEIESAKATFLNELKRIEAEAQTAREENAQNFYSRGKLKAIIYHAESLKRSIKYDTDVIETDYKKIENIKNIELKFFKFFTKREKEIFYIICDTCISHVTFFYYDTEFYNKIANDLNISQGVVRFHIHNIFHKIIDNDKNIEKILENEGYLNNPRRAIHFLLDPEFKKKSQRALEYFLINNQ